MVGNGTPRKRTRTPGNNKSEKTTKRHKDGNQNRGTPNQKQFISDVKITTVVL